MTYRDIPLLKEECPKICTKRSLVALILIDSFGRETCILASRVLMAATGRIEPITLFDQRLIVRLLLVLHQTAAVSAEYATSNNLRLKYLGCKNSVSGE